MRNARLPVILFVLANLAQASPLPPAARVEVTALLKVLADSDCEFYRNGSWYAGPKAASHLLRKLEYLEDKDMLTDVDSFIELAASKSSMSGETYQVRCPGKAPLPSADWLNQRLDVLRDSAGERTRE